MKRRYFVTYLVTAIATSDEEALNLADDKLASEPPEGEVLFTEPCDDEDD
jgi:hypothetical protein